MIAIWQMTAGKTKVFFSTDTEMPGEDVIVYASLSAIDAAKVLRHKSDRSISMPTFKLLMVNQYLSKRIFSMSVFRSNIKIATNRIQKNFPFD